MERESVWVVTIDIVAPVVAVGSTRAMALHSAGVRAAQVLNENGYATENGELWEPATVAEMFCVNVTRLDIGGAGMIQNCYE